MIHVAYRLWGGDGFFAKMCGVSMLSMFENTKEKVTVHIMHNERLTPENRGKFCYIAGQYNQRVEFHNVEEIAGDMLQMFADSYPTNTGVNAAWYAMISHKVFPDLERIIFLGTDMVINLDIGEMWAYDLDAAGYEIAAVPELNSNIVLESFQICVDGVVKLENYFNVDVMMFKTDFFQKNFDRLMEGFAFIREKGRYYYFEQDILNYLFSTNYLKLPAKFNRLVNPLRRTLRVQKIGAEVYHFAGLKPTLNTDDVYNKLYWNYFLKTPWATAEIFGNIDREVRKNFLSRESDMKALFLNLANVLTRRKRAFFVMEGYKGLLKDIFQIQDDELLLGTDGENSFQPFFEELVKSKGEKIFFIFIKNYGQLRKFLLKKNFIEGRDFINLATFLSERHGIKPFYDTKFLASEI